MMTLEQEFEIRKQYHMQQIVASHVAMEFKKDQTKSDDFDLQLPSFIVDEMATKQGLRILQQVMQEGMLEGAYLQAWDNVKGVMPDNYNSLQSIVDNEE